MKVILASESKYKQELLRQTGLSFEAIPSDYEEDMNLPLTPEELVLTLARGKAQPIVREHPDAIVIATDNVIVFQGEVVGKPKNKDEARARLREYVGKDVEALTGLVIIKGEDEWSKVASGTIHVRDDISDEEIESYLQTGEPMSCSGGLHHELLGATLIEGQEGDHTAIIGLPIYDTLKRLRALGVNPLMNKKEG